jgi:hypothetical protein
VLSISLEIGVMVSIIGLEYLLEWKRLSLFGRFGYVEMIMCLMIKVLLPCRSSIGYALFMVVFITGGEPRPIYGSLYMVGGYSKKYFFPTWMTIAMRN